MKSNLSLLKSKVFFNSSIVCTFLLVTFLTSCTDNSTKEQKTSEIDTNVVVAPIKDSAKTISKNLTLPKANTVSEKPPIDLDSIVKNIKQQTDTLPTLNILLKEIKEEYNAIFSTDEANIDGSQIEWNISSYQKYLKRKNLLAKIILAIKKDFITVDYDRVPNFIINLDISQELWYNYMQAQALVKFPEESSIRSGSAFNACFYSYLAELTEPRIKTLNKWLIGEFSGEMCSGTIENKRSNN